MNTMLEQQIEQAWARIEGFGPRGVAELWLTPNDRIVDVRHRTTPPARRSVEIGSYRKGITLGQLTEDVMWVVKQREVE